MPLKKNALDWRHHYWLFFLFVCLQFIWYWKFLLTQFQLFLNKFWVKFLNLLSIWGWKAALHDVYKQAHNLCWNYGVLPCVNEKQPKINNWLFVRQKAKIKFFCWRHQIRHKILHRILFLAHTAVRVLRLEKNTTPTRKKNSSLKWIAL